MASAAHNSRSGRESVSKRIGKVATNGIKNRDCRRCAYCQAAEADELAAGRHMHLDHLTPRSEGGEDAVTNLVLACHRCNSARRNMTLRQWAAYALVKLGLIFTATAIRAQARRKLVH